MDHFEIFVIIALKGA